MPKKTVDDYIEQGIYGPKEINPDERRKFLGTLRERIALALTSAEVRQQRVQQEVLNSFKQNSGAKLYLNGHIDYSHLSKYIKAATERNISYTIVTNKDHNSEIGLVLAYDYAVDREFIYLNEQGMDKELPQEQMETTEKKKFSLKSLFGRFK